MAQETINKESRIPIIPNTRPVMKSTLIVSMVLHLVILIGLQKSAPFDWVKKPLKIYHVELIRPAVEPLENEKKEEKTELGKVKPEKKGAPQLTEDTISLDTKDKRYVTYVDVIKGRLLQHWNDYPDEAWANLLEGEVLVLFSLNRQGQLIGLKALRPSHYKVFNKETTRTIRSAAPFPPFPTSIKVMKLNIKANFEYKLTANK